MPHPSSSVVTDLAAKSWGPLELAHKDNPHQTFKGKGIVDIGYYRYITGNKAYLIDYQDFNGGPVAFEGSKGQITGKGKIKT
nr:hypothetical protein [Tanacetum cinerariifolium]